MYKYSYIYSKSITLDPILMQKHRKIEKKEEKNCSIKKAPYPKSINVHFYYTSTDMNLFNCVQVNMVGIYITYDL